ncbi:MAG TPA: carboxypeptidase-like regulatory domain-containing protein [Terracidiphilus sp.]|nr:carboxypeptidase-like regulatory domain-containing protein [Terracidiphilus sp.]
MRKTKVFLSSLVMAVCLSAVAGFAQNTNSADLRGTVTDPNGAVVAGATVSVQDIDKDLTRTFITDKAGLFETGPIVPDHYLVTVSAPGFKTVIRGPITLEVGTDTLNAELTVGEAHEQVVVTTDLPLLETESGSQTEALESNTMAELPQYGSDWQNFVFMVPGAQFSYRTGQTAEINGNLPYNSVLADGATTTLPMSSNSDVTIFEATSEVKVDSNAFSAQYGLGGIIFNQISKGGGDKFHGSAYEYFQNDALNAADFSITGGKNKVAFQRYDNYGFSVGGPVLVPHTKIGKNVFFFFDYDRTYSNGGSGNTVLSVPTDAMKQGDFTGLPTIFDYKTQQLSWVQDPSSGAWVPDTVRKSFADEYGNGNKLPSSYFSPLMLEFQKFFPEPNVPGNPTSGNGMPHNNYTTNVPNLGPFIKYFGRLDYTPTANHRFTISETASDNPAISYGYGKALCPINCQSQDVSRDNAQVSDVWTINANMVNEARMGFTDQLNFFSPFSQGQGYPEKMGIKWAVADAIPPVDLMSLSSLSEPSNSVYKEFVFDPSDVFTLVHGRHVLHFGGEFLISRADSTAWGNENPGETYFGGYYSDGCIVDSCKWDMSSINQQNNDDAEYSDFLQGLSAMWWGNFTPEFGARIKNPQAFVQDDLKLRPNVTLNLGLRWFGTTGFNEVKGHMAVFDPTVVNGGSGNDPNGNPAANQLGGIWYGFSHANGRTTLQAPVWDTFLPRIGVSWAVDAKTVVRGGFGLYNYSWSEDTYGAGMGGGAGGSGGAWDPSNGIYYQLQMDSDGSLNYEGPQNGSQGCTTGCWGKSVQGLWVVNPTTSYAQNGNGASYNQYHTPVPKIWQYNLTVERQIGNTMKAQAAYVGSKGSNLNFGVDINQIPASELSAIDTAPGSNKRPFPLFTGLGGSTNNAVSDYNSLQLVFQKRLAYGLEADANYVWSKFLDSMDSAGWGSSVGTQNYQNSYCVKCNWGPSNFDQRHVLSVSAIYTLPFGRGAQFLNNNAIADEIIGGWRLAATTRDNSGSPFTPTMATNTSYSQAGALYPNLIGDPNQMVTPRSIHNWYNKDAFGAPAVATFGNAHRNSVYGPSYYNLNLSFGKTFNIVEKAKFEIRADAQNALNHPILGNPDSGIGNNNPAQLNSVIDGGRHIQLYGKFTF